MAKVNKKPVHDLYLLHEIPRGSRLKLRDGKITHDIIFHHLDGMYSYCTVDQGRAVIHLSTMTPLRKYKDYYLILD